MIMRVSVIQLNARQDRQTNVQNALRLVDQAAEQGALFVELPECTTFLGSYNRYAENSESVPGPTSELMSAKAKQHGIYLHAGSLTERSSSPDRFYNTSLLFDPQGKLIATYRKVHLFDVDVPNQVTETESSVVLPGDKLVIVNLPEFCLGLSICFDLRFPELYRALALAGAQVLVIPSAFARATGQAHWHVLQRARAIENHAFVLAADQYGPDTEGHMCFGHSLIVDPWGVILAEASAEGEAVLVVDIDLDQVRQRREQIAVLQVRRPDAYARFEKL
jgi:deaminated glutathione amidase